MKKIIFLFLLYSCSTPDYLVTVETGKPKSIEVKKPGNTQVIDSLVLFNFGHALKGFSSDSIFNYSPYLRIETLNKTIYAEEKNNK